MEKAFVIEMQRSLFEDLYLCFAGMAECEAGHFFGPAVRPNWILHYITKGKGIYKADGHVYHLEAGQGFLICPHEMTYYEADLQEPWSYCWVGFAGSRAERVLADIGLGHERLIYNNRQGSKIEHVIRLMCRENGLSLASKYRLQGLLLELVACMVNSTIELPPEEKESHVYIQEAIRYIQTRFGSNIQVDDIARYLGVNRSYLYKIFKKELGMSVQDYLIQFRISNARELLAVSPCSIAEIAEICGYEDTRTFGKLFKRETGTTCSEYRKIHKETLQKENTKAIQSINKAEDENSV